MPTCKTITWSLALGGCLLWGAPALATDPVPIDGALLTAMTFLNSSTGKQTYWSTTVFPTVNCANCGGAGGGGGVATQGGRDSSVSPWETNIFVGSAPVSTSNVLPTGDFALDALIAGGKFAVTDALLDAAISGGVVQTALASGSTINITATAPTDTVQSFTLNSTFALNPVDCGGGVTTCGQSTFALPPQTASVTLIMSPGGQIQAYGGEGTNNAVLDMQPTKQVHNVSNNQGNQTTGIVSNLPYCIATAGLTQIVLHNNVASAVSGTMHASPAPCPLPDDLTTEPPYPATAWIAKNVAFGSGATAYGPYLSLQFGSNGSRNRILRVKMHCSATAASTVDVDAVRRSALTTVGSGGASAFVNSGAIQAGAPVSGSMNDSATLVSGQSNSGAKFWIFTGATPTTGGTVNYLDTKSVTCPASVQGADTYFDVGYPSDFSENWTVPSSNELDLAFTPPAGLVMTATIKSSEQNN